MVWGRCCKREIERVCESESSKREIERVCESESSKRYVHTNGWYPQMGAPALGRTNSLGSPNPSLYCCLCDFSLSQFRSLPLSISISVSVSMSVSVFVFVSVSVSVPTSVCLPLPLSVFVCASVSYVCGTHKLCG